MKNKKLLWIGILIGFLAAVILFGAAILTWKLLERREEATIETSPVITPGTTAAPEPTPVELETSLWEGTWERTGDTQFDGSVITITDPKDGTISFRISANSGGSSGEVKGNATVEGNTALFKGKEPDYTISFTADAEAITVTMEGDTAGVLGNGVWIDGSYRKGEQEKITRSLVELGFFESSEQEQVFKDYLKDDYKLFTDTFQLYTPREDLDSYRAKVTSGGIRSLFSVNEGIIMAGPDNIFWAAVIDDSVVKYYTNSTDKEVLPITIDRWRQSFKELKVVLAESGEELQALSLEALTNKGFEQLAEQSFQLEIKDLGKVTFISGVLNEAGNMIAEYYLVNEDGEIIYRFPSATAGQYIGTRAVSFQNISSGSINYGVLTDITDVVIIEDYTDPDREYGDVPYAYCRIFSWNGAGFDNRTDLYEELNSINKNENVMMVMDYLLDKAGRKTELRGETVKIQEELAQQVTLNNWGQVNFIPAVDNTEGKRQLKLYLADAENTVLYRFAVTHQDNLQSLKEISFTDVNQDGLIDLVVLAEYDKADGSGAYPYCDIYIQSGSEFLPALGIMKEINTSGKNESIAMAFDYLKGRKLYLGLSDLTAQGFTIFNDKILSAYLEGWGDVNLVPGYKKGIGVNELSVYITDRKGNILYRLPELDDRDCYGVSQIALQDVNRDGRKDILVIANYTTGFKTDGITPIPYCNLYLQVADHTYVNLPQVDGAINYRVKEVTIAQVVDLLSNEDIGIE